MSLTLVVDGPRWRAQLQRLLDQQPGLVPVVKGNGYGFGRSVLLTECRRLADAGTVDRIAVGTHAEALEAVAHFPGDVLVLEPYRQALQRQWSPAETIIHTVSSREDLRALRARHPDARIVLEGRTSMNRHGMTRAEVAESTGEDAALGVTLHLPLGGGNLAEVDEWMSALPQVPEWLVSHLDAAELAELSRRHRGVPIRPRVGTALWLGDPEALQVRADVLDVRAVAAGDRAGYRRRRMAGGTLLVVSGGTAHGVAMTAPSAVTGLRQRAIVMAEAALEAAGRVRSPFSWQGRPVAFVEPPHMQVSLLLLPPGLPAPAVGDALAVRIRHTTMSADAVVIR